MKRPNWLQEAKLHATEFSSNKQLFSSISLIKLYHMNPNSTNRVYPPEQTLIINQSNSVTTKTHYCVPQIILEWVLTHLTDPHARAFARHEVARSDSFRVSSSLNGLLYAPVGLKRSRSDQNTVKSKSPYVKKPIEIARLILQLVTFSAHSMQKCWYVRCSKKPWKSLYTIQLFEPVVIGFGWKPPFPFKFVRLLTSILTILSHPSLHSVAMCAEAVVVPVGRWFERNDASLQKGGDLGVCGKVE
jgi:hypothetical protein